MQGEEWEGGGGREEKFAGCHLPSVVCPACHVLVAVQETTVSWAAPMLIANQLCALAPVLVCDQQPHVQMWRCWSLAVRSLQSGPLSNDIRLAALGRGSLLSWQHTMARAAGEGAIRLPFCGVVETAASGPFFPWEILIVIVINISL